MLFNSKGQSYQTITSGTEIVPAFYKGTILENEKMKLFEVDPNGQYDNNCFSIVYINGSQLAHYSTSGNSVFDLVGNKHGTGFIGAPSRYGHLGNFYNSQFKPFIAKYKTEPAIGSFNYTKPYFSDDHAESLLELLSYLNTNKIILVGQSYGGLVVGKAARDSSIFGAYALNPPIWGTPLADLEKLKQYNTGTVLDNFITNYCSKVLEPEKGFQEEDRLGTELTPNSRLHIFGGSVRNLNPKNIVETVMKLGDKKIHQMTEGRDVSDGMVIWREEELRKKGFDFVSLQRPWHAEMNSKHYVDTVYQHIMEKRL